MEERPVLSPKLLRDLATVHPFGREPLPVELVEAWWDSTWPLFRLQEEKRRRAYKQRARAIRAWWARARLGELDRAREILERRLFDQAAARQRDLLAAPPPEFRPATRVALRKIMGGRS